MNVLIIGATSGIGKSLALLYAQEECNVICTGRREGKLKELASAYPERIEICHMDVVRGEESLQALDETVRAKGEVDLIILSAGTGELNESLEFLPELKTIEVNVEAFTRIAGWAYKLLSEQKRGHFACITSVAGLRGNRVSPSYNASKAYQINYLEGLRQKIRRARLPIFITDIRPGSVDTDMMKGEGHFWISTADKAAIQIKRALDNKKRICYITRRWVLIGWLLKWLPSCLYERL